MNRLRSLLGRKPAATAPSEAAAPNAVGQAAPAAAGASSDSRTGAAVERGHVPGSDGKRIQVFLRHCYVSHHQKLQSRTRPDWFDKIKVLNNFKRTLQPELASYTIVYDNHFGPRAETFLADEPNCVEIDCGTEAASFLETYDLATGIAASEDTIIYFLEDDYLHREGWCEALIEGFDLGVHYVSLYDHPDKYFAPYNDLQSTIRFTKSAHWRATPSTCNSYAGKLSTLRQDRDIHRHYSINNFHGGTYDHAKFEALWKHKRFLVSALPAFATHCDEKYLAPVIDWPSYCV